jgi:UDP-N-acetylmuramate: L-alanyl-gamma-D-glutamyl-meso-diaminopimelate ligase
LKEIYPGRRLIAVFEPRSNTSRRNFFQDDYAASFGAADCAVILEVQSSTIYSGTAAPVVSLDVQRLSTDLNARGIRSVALPSVTEIANYLKAEARAGDVIVLMSNGDFDGLPALLPPALLAL